MSGFATEPRVRKSALAVFIILLAVVVASEITAHVVMTNNGSVDVSNVWIKNKNSLMIRGKLYRPLEATVENPAPGVVYLHGYQNNRETSDPYAIELSRRGFVVIALDTLGRGNSENQFSEDEPGFDPTYGGDSAFEYLRGLPFVDGERCGLGGHSLGGEMSYAAAVINPNVKAIIFSGYAYLNTATYDNPPNMLMVFGKHDEYRARMTGVNDFEKDWMTSPQTKAAINAVNPKFDTTYGSFKNGTARRVHMTNTTHVSECFDTDAIAEGVHWFSEALNPNVPLAIDPENQVWRIKEVGSLAALIFGVLSVIPLGILLLGIKPFSKLIQVPSTQYVCTKKTFWKANWINGLLTLLYLPIVLIVFGIEVYVMPITKVFPMIMVDGVAFWFLIINVIGFLIFRGWIKKQKAKQPELDYQELGISDKPDKIRLRGEKVWRVLLLAAILFGYLYALEAGLEHFLLIDWRYKFPYASDLTSYRWGMLLLYFPLFLIGWIQVNILTQAQLRPASLGDGFRNALKKSWRGILVMIIPLLFYMALQYIPLYAAGIVPFIGPGSGLIGFVINLEHMCVLIALMIPIAAFFYEATGSVYLGAILNALIVAWMFTSSSVVAPLPV